MWAMEGDAKPDPYATLLDTSSLAQSRSLLLAVSGGPDSTALLLLVDRWCKNAGVPVAVATVDHRFRLESASEAEAVAALCRARNLPHHTLVREGAPPKTRIQERAREARYSLLLRCAKEIGADTIVTGHHAEDQAETILMRLTRGSGLAGLAGMAAVSERDGAAIARPLLSASKADLIAICREEGVGFVEDPSNTSARFRRTGLRRLATTLAAEGLDAAALCRLGRRAARAEAAMRWAQETGRPTQRSLSPDDEVTLPASDLAALPEELALRLVGAEMSRLSPQTVQRLDRLEALVGGLRTAISQDASFSATLAGCIVRHRQGAVTIGRAPPRRITRMTNVSPGSSEDRYLSSPALLGKAGRDA